MSKQIKISTFNMPCPTIGAKPKSVGIVDYATDFVLSKLDLVLPDKPDLIVLPEHLDLPSGMKTEEKLEFYDERGDHVLNVLSKVARENSTFILYNSVLRDSEGRRGNTSVLLNRDGKAIYKYNKCFPVIFEMEGYGVAPGKHAVTVDCELGRVGAITCFDLNFTELMDEYRKARPNLILFSSNYHGGMARNFFALTTSSYLVASIGAAGCPGEIIDPLGESIAATSSYVPFVSASVNMDYVVCHLDENRGKFDSIKKKYGDKVKIKVPSFLGPAIISSESDELTAMDVVRDFELELMQDYFNRSRKVREDHLV